MPMTRWDLLLRALVVLSDVREYAIYTRGDSTLDGHTKAVMARVTELLREEIKP
jgi:hypothetical protein